MVKMPYGINHIYLAKFHIYCQTMRWTMHIAKLCNLNKEHYTDDVKAKRRALHDHPGAQGMWDARPS